MQGTQRSCHGIRQIDFRKDALPVAKLIQESFHGVFTAEGVAFERYIELVRKWRIPFFLSLLHPLLSRVLELFVWGEDNELYGVGMVQRLDAHNSARWLLCNFAFSSDRARSFQAIVRARALMRRALAHASRHGASQVVAFIRDDNRAAHVLCQMEGFKETGGYSYYLIDRPKFDLLVRISAPATEATLKVRRINVWNMIVYCIYNLMLGRRLVEFAVQSDGSTIAHIKIVTHLLSTAHAEIHPLAELTTETGRHLVRLMAMLVRPTSGSVLFVFPSKASCLINLMTEYAVPKLFERKLLVLELSARDC